MLRKTVIGGLIGLVGLLATLTWETSPSLAQNQAATETVPPGAYLTEFAVKTNTVPARDYYAVYDRLKGGSANQTQTTTKRTYQLDEVETFNVLDLQSKSYYQVKARLVGLTAHVYMFLDVNSNQDRAALARLAEQFEAQIYPTTRRYFGEEASPGVDNDPHLVILNTTLKQVAGYFSSDDTLLKAINPYSNEREMFYIGSGPSNANSYLGTLAHEFQHMIQHNALPNQDLWLNEGDSVLSQVLNGFSSNGYENSFFARPDTQLNNWTCSSCGTLRYYGGGYAWVSYLQDHFGFEAVRNIALNGKGLTGFNSVDYALYFDKHPDLSSETVLKQFVVANYLNRRSADPTYNYKTINSKVENINQLGSNSRNDSVNQFAAAYYNVQGSDNGFTLDFKGATTVKLAGPGAHSGQQAWWSNRGDNSDMTLTRTVDLSGVKSATLKLWTWFDTEPGYDWLYVEVSTDNGQSWQIVPGKRSTTTQDPSGKSYGPGLTGQSGANGLDLSDTEEVRSVWGQDSFDLSKFAGQPIKLRLEYLTDEGYSRQGALFDDFEIPEIGWKDDVEGGENGWEAAGFVRSNVTLPQHFWVQVIRRDGACGASNATDLSKADNGQSCVQEMVLDANNAGSMIFPYRQAVVVVAPYAPKTLQPASFTLKATPK
jgi:immune inhibitor A